MDGNLAMANQMEFNEDNTTFNNMENYERLIINLCKGETPKQKYDWLFDQLTKLSSAKSFVHALHGTWDEASIKNIRNFINDINETLNK